MRVKPFWILSLTVVGVTACGVAVTPGSGGEGPPSDKVFVCKYVSKPGEDERLQTGDNPISVSINSLVGPGEDINIGDEFQDAQIRSVVIAFDTGQPEPSPEDCPQPTPPTTTTVAPTTTHATTTTVPTTNTFIVTTTTGVTTSTSSTTTTSSLPPTTTSTTTSSTVPSSTTTTLPGQTTTTTTLPPTFQFAGAASICVVEVPTIRITFQNLFPQLAGVTGTLTMADINGNVVSTQPLVYQPGATVDLLYPGTSVNPDGSIADVPGWILTNAGLWVRDESDAFLREGINLTYTVNPTATAFITYPPESSACANPDGPFPPGATPPPPGVPTVRPPGSPRVPPPAPGVPGLPSTR